jgi:DegV family protein with EDD domain
MSKYVILTDSSSDFDAELREKYDVHYVPNRFSIDGKEYNDDTDWKTVSLDVFYDYLKTGNRIITSQISAVACTEMFEKFLSEGYDILSLSCPEVLSSTVNVCRATRDKLQEKYPERKIICIDTTISSGGLTLLCVKAAEMRNEGKTIEETAAWVEENKKFIHQEGSVESLTYLKRAGRISAASAFFGGLLHIKPMIISDIHGYNVAIEKVKGRKTSILRAAERFAEAYRPEVCPYVFIHHTVCEADALFLKEEILKRVDIKEEYFHIGNVNGVMGASVGPGMIGVFFYGTEITYDSKVKE